MKLRKGTVTVFNKRQFRKRRAIEYTDSYGNKFVAYSAVLLYRENGSEHSEKNVARAT